MFKFIKGTLIDKIKHCAANRLKELRNMMPELLFKKAELYGKTLQQLLNEIGPVGMSKVDDFIIFKARVMDLNDTIDDYKPASDFITALSMII